MASIDMLNMLEKARGRAANNARLVAQTRGFYETAVQKSMIANAKKLKATLTRQETALALANEEVREIEQALAAEGDLVSQAQKPQNNRPAK